MERSFASTRAQVARSFVFVSALALGSALAFSLVGAPTKAAAQSRPETERLELQMDEQITISATGVASYSVGAPGVATVALSPNGDNFVIGAVRPGVTSLLLLYSNGRQVRYSITVLDPTAARTTGGVPVRENIRLDLYFVQLQESYSHQIGIGFPGSIGGSAQIANIGGRFNLLTGNFANATLQVTNQALPRLDLAQVSGWARLLRQAMLVTANGQEAEINSGGEVNVIVSGGFGGQLQRVEFGSIIQVTPRYDPDTRRIEIAIEADVSDLTEATTPGGPPGRTRTALSTVVNLELGQSIVLGGLVSRSTQESQGGLPGLSQIPIVGVLFGTNQHRDENLENLLFIIPTVVQAVPRAEADRIAEALRLYQRHGSIGAPGLGETELIEPSPPGYE